MTTDLLLKAGLQALRAHAPAFLFPVLPPSLDSLPQSPPAHWPGPLTGPLFALVYVFTDRRVDGH